MNEVGICFWNKVIRVFISAVRLLADSLARGEKEGVSRKASAGFFLAINFIIMQYGMDSPLGCRFFGFIPGAKYAFI
jgi:hypothetical protein